MESPHNIRIQFKDNKNEKRNKVNYIHDNKWLKTQTENTRTENTYKPLKTNKQAETLTPWESQTDDMNKTIQ